MTPVTTSTQDTQTGVAAQQCMYLHVNDVSVTVQLRCELNT